jgi:hypothetical protein
VIGLIHGFVIADSVNVFLSWVFIGFWFSFTFYYIRKHRLYREFGSPHNTATFVLGPVFTGILFSAWGYYAGLLEENLLGDTIFYFSKWIFFFAVPYLVIGLYQLYSCYKRYDVVYIRQKSISARKFGIISTCLALVVEVSIMIYNGSLSSGDPVIDPVHYGPDLMLFITSLFSVFLLIRYGIFYSRPSVTQLAAVTSTRPREGYDLPAPSPRASTRSSSRSSSPSSSSQRSSTTRSSTRSSLSPRGSTRSASTRTSSKTSSRTRAKTSSRTKKKGKPKAKPRVNVNKYLPKAGKLTLEDFKCIMCFQLPDPVADKGRGIILCPKCRHPAHADEFRDWLKSSNLCSRCDTPLPARVRNNPEIIPVEFYVKLIKKYAKK